MKNVPSLTINQGEIEIEAAPATQCEDCLSAEPATLRIAHTSSRRTFLVDLCDKHAYFWLCAIGYRPCPDGMIRMENGKDIPLYAL